MFVVLKSSVPSETNSRQTIKLENLSSVELWVLLCCWLWLDLSFIILPYFFNDSTTVLILIPIRHLSTITMTKYQDINIISTNNFNSSFELMHLCQHLFQFRNIHIELHVTCFISCICFKQSPRSGPLAFMALAITQIFSCTVLILSY